MAVMRFSRHDRPPLALEWFMVRRSSAPSGLTLLLYAGPNAGISGVAWTGIFFMSRAALGN
jgi:hypothetical protein